MESAWWDERSACPKAGSKSSTEKSKLSLSAVAGIFYILILGMTTAIACSLLEYLYFKHREKQQKSPSTSSKSSNIQIFPGISKSSSTASNSSCRPIISKNVSFQEDFGVLENYDYEKPKLRKVTTFPENVTTKKSRRKR